MRSRQGMTADPDGVLAVGIGTSGTTLTEVRPMSRIGAKARNAMERASGLPFRAAAAIVIGLEVCQWAVWGDTATVMLINYLQLGTVALVFGGPWAYHFVTGTGDDDHDSASDEPAE
jgi:hypothetical protein